MTEHLLDLQLFGEGGDSSGGEGTAVGSPANSSSENLSDVIYGKTESDTASQNAGETPAKTKAQSFDELIKGEYKDEYSKRVQKTIQKRFGENQKLQSTIESHNPIMALLAERYGIDDPSDIKSLQSALENDTAYLQQEALEQGMSVKQLQHIKQLERENSSLRAAGEQQAREERSHQIYNDWMNQGTELAAKYNLQDFDFETEAQNEDFTKLLAAGLSVEGAWKAVHFDEIAQGLIQTSTAKAKEAVVNNVKARAARPSENGISSRSAATFKTDVHSLTKADRAEIVKRSARGANIRF